MQLAIFIAEIQTFIWLLPPLRQYRSRFFWFFLNLALSDAIVALAFDVFDIKFYPQYLYTVFAPLLFFAVLYHSVRFSLYVPVITTVVLSGILYIFGSLISYLEYICIIIHLMIIYLLVKETIISLSQTRSFNVFILVLSLYELSQALKWYQFAMRTRTGFVFFYITTVFEILLAIFFTVFRPDSPSMTIKFGDKEPSNL
ncbi:MAG: hypothetical protein ACM3SM_03705 [Bacteroidota bacterium]